MELIDTIDARKKILFVDDEVHVLDGMRRLLNDQRQNWDMIFVASAQEALDKIKESRFDTIVSDITMPGKNGLELLQELRAGGGTKDIPVVILTGLNEREVKRRALDFGATDLLNKPVDREELLARIRSCLRQKDYLEQIKTFNEALNIKVKERTLELAESRLDMILRLGYMAEYREKTAGVHGIKVGCYARVIAESLGLDKNFTERLFIASTLHDIGKIGVPEKVLNKKDTLSFEEWDLLRKHCVIGAEILGHKIQGTHFLYSMEGRRFGKNLDPQKNPLLKMAAVIALTHHEWWNGKGYPQGLRGEEIPLESRIVALADVLDELTTDHPYKPGGGFEEGALGLIRKSIGVQFDPNVYAAFDKSLYKIQDINKEFSKKEPVGESDNGCNF